MLYISGARSVVDEHVRIASTKIDGIGPKKTILVHYRLGISGNIKIKELTKYQIDQTEQMIGQDRVVHWELKRGEQETSNDSFIFLVIVEFIIKMDHPYAVNEHILMLGLVASKFRNERSIPKALVLV